LIENPVILMSNPFNHFRHTGFIILFAFQSVFSTLQAQNETAATSAANVHQMLFDAIRSGSSEALKKALANNADANDSLTGYSALMMAALEGTADQMSMLINHGARMNDSSRNGITALWLALPTMEKITLLLDHDADINHKISGYGILVKLATMPGQTNLFQFLISRGVDPMTSSPDNLLLYNAASTGDTTLLGFLLRLGFKVNDTTSFGEVPLNAALTFRTPATLKMLIEHGANVNFQNLHEQNLPAQIGFTPLMNAALYNDRESFFSLLENGADPNLRSKNGYTALILLQESESTDLEMTRALIRHGAKTGDKAPDGTDALFYAKEKGKTPIVELLEKYQQK
jgi:ankyrin repeat protein